MAWLKYRAALAQARIAFRRSSDDLVTVLA
jgi:hypothetical protein